MATATPGFDAPERTATCPDPTCPWELEVWGPEDELVVADHAHQHAERAEHTASR